MTDCFVPFDRLTVPRNDGYRLTPPLPFRVNLPLTGEGTWHSTLLGEGST